MTIHTTSHHAIGASVTSLRAVVAESPYGSRHTSPDWPGCASRVVRPFVSGAA